MCIVFQITTGRIEMMEDWEEMWQSARDLERRFIHVNASHDLMLVTRVIKIQILVLNNICFHKQEKIRVQFCVEGRAAESWRIVIDKEVLHVHCSWTGGHASFDEVLVACQRMFESDPNPLIL